MRYIKKAKIKASKSDLTILYDKQEKKPWMFLQDFWPMERVHLKVGDYTIQGYEDKFTLEKKSGINELFTDLSGSYRGTFERFLKKLSVYPIKCIIVEEPLTKPVMSRALKILRKKSKGKSELTVRTITYWTSKIIENYGIPILFLDKPFVKPVVLEIVKSAYLNLRGE